MKKRQHTGKKTEKNQNRQILGIHLRVRDSSACRVMVLDSEGDGAVIPRFTMYGGSSTTVPPPTKPLATFRLIAAGLMGYQIHLKRERERLGSDASCESLQLWV